MNKFKMNLFIFLSVFPFCGAQIAAAQSGKPMLSQKQLKSEIAVVIDNFQKAILTKDSTLFSTVFFDKNAPVIGVMSEKTEMSFQAKNPYFQGLSVSNSERFIREICKSPKQQIEIFEDIQIETGERIATVQFDYAFVINQQLHQWGEESWSLTFAEGQWFITGINYTIRYPNIEKPTRNISRALHAGNKTNG